ncbi:MAG: tetratricopeptide repeat protein [Bryobacterales bacterium]|nr:tetratricopeptide repeat protein [Bryobacterales bacterium]
MGAIGGQSRAPVLNGAAQVAGGVLLAFLILLFATVRITQAYRTERRDRAEAHFIQGRELGREQRLPEAIEQYRAAMSIVRTRRDYRQALALALFRAGRIEEAEIHLRQLLEADPTDGETNLVMARIRLQQENEAEARLHFNRAVYGQWTDEPVANRIGARFELAEVLKNTGARTQVQSELLAILGEAPVDDLEVRKRVARLMLENGSATEAANLYQELLKSNDQEPELWAGLGRAEFVRGRYPEAQAAWRSALQWRPEDAALRRDLEVVDTVVSLDPTARRLWSGERLRRSQTLVKLAKDDLEACLPAERSQEVESILATAQETLERRIRPGERTDAIDANIDLAGDLWKARASHCAPTEGPPGPLDLLIAKLAR